MEGESPGRVHVGVSTDASLKLKAAARASPIRPFRQRRVIGTLISMLWRKLVHAAGLLLVVACTAGGSDPGQSTTTTGDLGTPSRPDSGLPGRLVVLDAAGNVVAVDPDGSDPKSVTDDADESTRYAQPSWSPGSDRLSWVEVTAAGAGVGLSDPTGGSRTRIDMTAPPFYLHWSPDSKAMGVLHNGERGVIELEMTDPGSGTTEVVADGSPLYFSWSPNSDRLVAHIRGDDLITIDLDGTVADLGDTTPRYPAPQWTPEGILHLGPAGLVLRGEAGESRVLATVRGQMAMAANGQGTLVAVQSLADDAGISAALPEVPALPAGSVMVIDVATGELTEVAPGLSVGFFWSPDGESLLLLRPSGQPGEVDVLVWSGGEATSQYRIEPERTFIRDVLQFFDQYSRSLRLWSPDSSAFALAGSVDGDPGIWVKTVSADDPVEVFEGTWAAWSEG